jgi:hypothetical protein
MIYSDGKPIKGIDGVDQTYLDNDMQSKVRDAMDFKKRLGNNLGNNDDILLIYCELLRLWAQ